MGLFSWIKGWFVDVAYDARAEGKGNGEKLWYAGTSQAALFTYRLFLVRFALNEIQDYCAPYIKEVGQKFDSTYVTIQGYYEELQNVKNKIDKITEGMGKVGEGLGNLKGLRLNNIADKLESMGADVRDLKGILNDLKGMQTKKNVNPSDIKERLNNAVEQAYATIEHPKSVPSIHFNVKEPFTDIFFDIFTMFLTGVWIWIAGVRNVKRRYKGIMKKRERRKAMEAMDPVVKKIINKEIERVMVEVRALQSELNEVTQRLPAVNASIMSLLEKSHKLDKLSFALISRAGLKSGIGEETVITRIGDKVVTAGEIGHRVGALSESYDQTFERLKDEIRLFEEACVRVPREMARITNDSGRRLHDEFERITLPEGQGLEGPMEMGDVDEDTGEWKI